MSSAIPSQPAPAALVSTGWVGVRLSDLRAASSQWDALISCTMSSFRKQQTLLTQILGVDERCHPHRRPHRRGHEHCRRAFGDVSG
jgi:hypothetical protein